MNKVKVNADNFDEIFSSPSIPFEFSKRLISKEAREERFEMNFKRFPNPMVVN